MNSFKKEFIKEEMIKTAGRLWNIPENEIDTNFDPLVLLMIEACAAELEKIGYGISSSHTRLLDRLADLLVPEAILGPVPASCIVSTTPVEPVADLTDQHHFYITQQLKDHYRDTYYQQDLFFTPIGSFKILKATLAYIFTGYKFFGIDKNNNSRQLLHTNDNLKNTTTSELWLAIEPARELTSLQGLSLYFELRSVHETENFYDNLYSAKAYINGRQIELGKGYYYNNDFELSPEEMLASGHHYTSKINRHVAGIYRKRFLYIKENIEAVTTPIPGHLKLPEQIAQQLSTLPLIYVRIELSGSFPQHLIDRLICNINAFPVLNRKKSSVSYHTDEWVNVVPLTLTGNFLDIDAITSLSGGEYKFRTSSETHRISEGEAIVRNAGVGKTSSQQVREMTAILTEAIRDQSAYFKEINNDFILTRLSEISKILARLEDSMTAASDNVGAKYYVMLRPKKNNDTVMIKYWSTDGENGNQIKAGATLLPKDHSLMKSKDTFIITNAYGGRSGVEESGKKHLLKQHLISRGKIISAEDVKLFCFQIFGDRIKQIEVRKGVNTGVGKNIGFIRVIDVIIHVEKNLLENMQDELEYLRGELEYLLTQSGSMVYPFRVMLTV